MENTEKVLFKDDAPRWFVAIGDSWVGPLFATEIYKKVIGRELSWAHFIWTPGQSNWERICDVEAFGASVPQMPNKAILTQLKGATQPSKQALTEDLAESTESRSYSGARMMRSPKPDGVDEARVWFLYFNDSQFGPFSREEVRRFLKVGKINERVHAWKDGMADWGRICEVAELREASGQTAATIKRELPKKDSTRSDTRAGPRRPMVARILMANQGDVLACVCRDISVGGMQVLCDRVPGEAGAHVKLNVSPSGPGAPEPFTAEGVIVRVLEDGRGFSFRFENLTPGAREAIERYIKNESGM